MHAADCLRFLFLIIFFAASLGWAYAADTLRILTWPGYTDPDIVKIFEQRHGIRAEVTTIDSDLDLWKKISHNQGRDFDVFAVNTAELQRYIRQDLVVAIDRNAVPNLARQLPRFRDARAVPGIARDNKLFAVPYTYSEMGLIYDPQQFPEPPDSIAALWDTRYRGKVIAYNGGTHNFSLAAQQLNLPSPFRIEEKNWPAAVDRLIALRRNVAGFYTQPEESVALFTKRRAALMLANFGSQQLKMLKAAGVEVGYVLPKEGALAWLDCWAIARGARNPALAAAWINYMLEDQPGEMLLQRQGLANTTSESPFFKPDARIVWLDAAESEERRNLLWGRIISGDRASKVLQP